MRYLEAKRYYLEIRDANARWERVGDSQVFSDANYYFDRLIQIPDHDVRMVRIDWIKNQAMPITTVIRESLTVGEAQ